MTTVDMVNAPPHYRSHPSGIECIEVTRQCAFSLGNGIKYIWRYEDKNGAEDLKKSRWYLRDVLTSGASSYLPAKAKQLLEEVRDLDTVVERRNLFTHLINGELDVACNYIIALVGIFPPRP